MLREILYCVDGEHQVAAPVHLLYVYTRAGLDIATCAMCAQCVTKRRVGSRRKAMPARAGT